MNVHNLLQLLYILQLQHINIPIDLLLIASIAYCLLLLHQSYAASSDMSSLSLSSSSSSLDDSLRSLDLEFLDDSRRSSISSSSSTSTSSVRWKDNIITQICTRPCTNHHDIPLLYYTKHEIRYFKARFGHLPRLEHRAQDACIMMNRHEHRR